MQWPVDNTNTLKSSGAFLSRFELCLFVCLDSKHPRQQLDYITDVPRLTSDNCMCCHTKAERGDHDFCLSRSHYIDTDPTSRDRARRSNPRPPDQELRALPTELPPPLPLPLKIEPCSCRYRVWDSEMSLTQRLWDNIRLTLTCTNFHNSRKLTLCKIWTCNIEEMQLFFELFLKRCKKNHLSLCPNLKNGNKVIQSITW